LIGDPNARDATCPASGLDHLAGGGERALPYFLRIVLDPARLGIVLRQLGPLGSVQLSVRREQHRAGGGGARVEDQDELGHESRVPFVSSEVERGRVPRLRSTRTARGHRWHYHLAPGRPDVANS